METNAFAMRPALHRGDSVLLLNQGRHLSAFDAFPGRHALIAVLPSADGPAGVAALQALESARSLADSGKAAFFAAFPGADGAVEVKTSFPSICFPAGADDWPSAFGAGPDGCWVIVDPMLRIVDIAPLGDRDRAFRMLERLPRQVGATLRPPAPILLLSDVLEPDLCRRLIEVFDRDGGRETGFMADSNGKAVQNLDQGWKRRRDIMLSDPPVVAGVRARIGRRVCPEIKKAFQFTVSRTERDLIARYDADTGGHFRAHRDDVGAASVAHRRFAMSIPLNDDFDGGELSFPEYGYDDVKPPAGTAVVFSASILHAVAPVTGGRRYVFLTFLFDEAAEKIRVANLKSGS